MEFLHELWLFIDARKKYRLLPLLLVMAVFGVLVVLPRGSAVALFIYTLL